MSLVVLKPDEIGDFVMATGAIRLLVREHGEENTLLVVKSEIAPLACREFPHARILTLPGRVRPSRRNRTASDFFRSFPLWRELRRARPDLCVCLRSLRNYLQTALFAAPRAARRVAAENLLVRGGGAGRRLAESALVRFAQPELQDYPLSGGGLPLELASHLSVVSAALGHPVSPAEIMPVLSTAVWQGGAGWLICPLSSRASKDYSAARWAGALVRACRQSAPPQILVAGGPGQEQRLTEFAAALRGGGLQCPVAVVPASGLDRFPDLVAAADLVLSVDTAAAHFACALGAPAVIVDSGKNTGVYGPYSRDGLQEWVVADRKKFGRLRWEETVPPDLVAEAIVEVISRARRP